MSDDFRDDREFRPRRRNDRDRDRDGGGREGGREGGRDREGGFDRSRSRRRGGGEYCPKGKCFDYKDANTLERFVNEVGKIKPRRQTGNCARCQRELAREVKRARFIALLPYIATND